MIGGFDFRHLSADLHLQAPCVTKHGTSRAQKLFPIRKRSSVEGNSMDTEKKASFNMMKLVGMVFVAAIVVAAVYFFVLTPGASDRQTISSAQNGTTEEHNR
jgi:hypothetical protein